MGKKIKPAFSIEEGEGKEQEEFERELRGTNYEQAIRVCRSPSDKRGHSRTMNFRCLPYYFRLAGEILTKEPRFRFISDVHRTAMNVGYKEILRALKGDRKIGAELDDLMFTIDRLEDEMSSDQTFRHFEARLKNIGKALEIYKSNKKVFRKKVEKYQKEIECLKDEFWRDRLLSRFRLVLESIQNGDPYGDGQDDFNQTVDGDL